MDTYNLRDAALKASDALPAAAGTVNGTAIDLGNTLTDRGARLEKDELLLSAPALTVTQLPNTTTMTYALQSSTLANFASNTSLVGSAIVQTGNNAAAAASYRFKLPTNCARYVRAVAVSANVGNATVGNCAASNMTLELLF